MLHKDKPKMVIRNGVCVKGEGKLVIVLSLTENSVVCGSRVHFAKHSRPFPFVVLVYIVEGRSNKERDGSWAIWRKRKKTEKKKKTYSEIEEARAAFEIYIPEPCFQKDSTHVKSDTLLGWPSVS